MRSTKMPDAMATLPWSHWRRCQTAGRRGLASAAWRTSRPFFDIGSVAGADFDGLLNGFAWGLGATDDIHASALYRRELVRRLGRQVLNEAIHAAS